MSIRFSRVKFLGMSQWLVEVGREHRLGPIRWKCWDGYMTLDDGATWSTVYYQGTCGPYPSYQIHPEGEMKTIDILLGVLGPHLRAAGRDEEAKKARTRQEEYWERMRDVRARARGAGAEA